MLNAAKPAKQINILYHLRLWQINEGYGVFVKYTWCNIIVFGIFKWRTLYQAVSDIQLVKQTEMVKSAIEEAERQTRKVFITTRFLLERSRHESLFYVMKLFFFFFFQTMGGTFTGKQQDCTKGIYALAGLSCFSFYFFFGFDRVEITFAQLKGGRVQIFALYSRGSERAFFDSVS